MKKIKHAEHKIFRFLVKWKKYFAVFLACTLFIGSMQGVVFVSVNAEGTLYTVTIDPSVAANGLSVFVSGVDTIKLAENQYAAKSGTVVSISSINETKLFSAWDIAGVSPASTSSPYTTFTMPATSVTLQCNTTAANPATDMGKTMSLAYKIHDFSDIYALQSIVNSPTSYTGAGNDFERFGIPSATNYTVGRNLLKFGYFKMTTDVVLSEPDSGQPGWVATKFFTGIGDAGDSDKTFRGVFDGQNHQLITNLNAVNRTYFGMFASVTADTATAPTVIRNVKVYGGVSLSSTTASNGKTIYFGGLVGYARGRSIAIYNCESRITTLHNFTSTGNTVYCGGLVGYLDQAGIASGSNNLYYLANTNFSTSINAKNLYVGGGFGAVNDSYVYDMVVKIDNGTISGAVTADATDDYAYVGGVAGAVLTASSGSDVVFKNCQVLSSGKNAAISASCSGVTAATSASKASAGGIAGYMNAVSGSKIRIAGNTLDANYMGDEGKLRMIGRDKTSGFYAAAISGGLYGWIGSLTGIKLDGPIGSGSTPDDPFIGNIQAHCLLNGNGASYNGAICGYGLFEYDTASGLDIDISEVSIYTLQKNTKKNTTSTAYGAANFTGIASYAGGLTGAMVADNTSIANVTLLGSINILVERESGTNDKGNVLVGGIIGYKKGGSLDSCRALFTGGEISIKQNSFVSSGGGLMLLGGIIGGYDFGAPAAGGITNCTFAGSQNASDPSYDSTTGYVGTGAKIYASVNSPYAAHGVNDPWVGGIVGYVRGAPFTNNVPNTVVSNCNYCGNKNSDSDGLFLYSNQGPNSPCVGGIAGFTSVMSMVNCHVKDMNLTGDGYTSNTTATDTDIIVGGLLALSSNRVEIYNSTVTDSQIKAYGRDYCLTYQGGLLGANFGSVAVVNGCIVENNVMYSTAQRKWAAGGGIVGYAYDIHTIVVDNCFSLDNQINVTSAATDGVGAGANIAAAGGIIGKSVSGSSPKNNIQNCFSSNDYFVTHVDSSQIYIGGLVGWRDPAFAISDLKISNSFYDALRSGTTTAVGGVTTTAFDQACSLYFSDIYLDNAIPSKNIFSTLSPYGITTSNARFTIPAGAPFTVTAPSTNGNPFVAVKKADATGIDTAFMIARITQYQNIVYNGNNTNAPGYATRTGAITVERDFGKQKVIVGDVTTHPTAITLQKDEPDGSTIAVGTDLTLYISGTEKISVYAITDAPLLSGDAEIHPVKWNVYDKNGVLVGYSAVSDCGVFATTEDNQLILAPNIPIDFDKSFFIEASSLIDGSVLSPRIKVIVKPVYVTDVRLSSYTESSAVNTYRGVIDNTPSSLGTAANPLIIVKGSSLNLNATVYGEGSLNVGTPAEVYVEPTISRYLFDKTVTAMTNANTGAASTAGGISIFADGTVFTNSPVTGDTYTVTVSTVGKDSSGNTVTISTPIYIRVAAPQNVTFRTTDIPAANMYNNVTAIIRGGNIIGDPTSMLDFSIDYKLTTYPQAGYGGAPRLYYYVANTGGTNPTNGTGGRYQLIPIVTDGNTAGLLAYAVPVGDPIESRYEVTIKANGNYGGPLTVAVSYDVSVSVMFIPQNGASPIIANIPIGSRIGAALPSGIAKAGYSLVGWYMVQSAANDAAYGVKADETTIINGPMTYYARWKYIINSSITKSFTYKEMQNISEYNDLIFSVTKDINYLGRPLYHLNVGVTPCPVSIPASDYDTPQVFEQKDGNDNLIAKIEITINGSGETVYTFTLSKDFVNPHINAANNQYDGVNIVFGYLDTQIIPEENVATILEQKMLQNSVFTVRFVANHWDDIVTPENATHAYRPEYQNAQKDVSVGFTSNGTAAILPKGTTVRLHYKVLNPVTKSFDSSVWTYVVTGSAGSSSFKVSDFTKIGQNVTFDTETFGQFVGTTSSRPEDYYFVITLPFKEQLPLGELKASCQFVSINETITSDTIAVHDKRGLDLTATHNAQANISSQNGGEIAISALFDNIFDNQYLAFDNRDKNFGIAVSFEKNGQRVFLPPASSVTFGSGPSDQNTILSTAAKPIEVFSFPVSAISPNNVITCTVSDKIADPVRIDNRQLLLKDPGNYLMKIQLVVSADPILYGHHIVLKTVAIPITVD